MTVGGGEEFGEVSVVVFDCTTTFIVLMNSSLGIGFVVGSGELSKRNMCNF